MHPFYYKYLINTEISRVQVGFWRVAPRKAAPVLEGAEGATAGKMSAGNQQECIRQNSSHFVSAGNAVSGEDLVKHAPRIPNCLF